MFCNKGFMIWVWLGLEAFAVGALLFTPIDNPITILLLVVIGVCFQVLRSLHAIEADSNQDRH